MGGYWYMGHLSATPMPDDQALDWTYEPPHPQQVLFRRLSAQLEGAQLDDVLGAAHNLFVNAIAQRYPDKDKALEIYDQLVAKARERLAEELARR